MLEKLAELPLGVPVTLVLDNARYQRCALVQDLAQRLDIELLFLPAYSPNLNLIEPIWKFVKQQCLYAKYYSGFSLFTEAIRSCLDQTNTTHQSALTSLLSLNFQTFNNVQL